MRGHWGQCCTACLQNDLCRLEQEGIVPGVRCAGKYRANGMPHGFDVVLYGCVGESGEDK